MWALFVGAEYVIAGVRVDLAVEGVGIGAGVVVASRIVQAFHERKHRIVGSSAEKGCMYVGVEVE